MLKPGKELKGKFNYKAGLSMMGGDALFYHSLLISFISEEAEYKEKITNPLNQNDPEQAAKAAHTLKGTSGNLSLISIQEMAKTLEITLKESPSDKDAIENAINTLFSEMNSVLPLIGELIS